MASRLFWRKTRTSRARNIGKMANGEKYYVGIQSSGVFQDGVPHSAQVKWTWTGTGKLNGVTANGTSRGSPEGGEESIWVAEGV